MKSFDTELQKYAQKIRLRAAERRDLRERVLAYMEYHPLPKRESLAKDEIVSQPFYAFRFNTLYIKIASVAFVFFFVVGVPLMAERAVPGDVLYLVKTGINESIQAQFANSPYEKVALETKLIERRIAEARLLASEGKLTEEVEAEIAEDVKTHADAVQNGLAELRVSDADEAAIAEITFGSALEVQSAVLDSNSKTDQASSTDSIRSAVMLAQADAVEKRGTTLPSFERLMARVELETTRAVELYESVKESASAEEQANIERRFNDINRNIGEAKNAVEEKREDAILELTKSLALTQKLIVFMTDIDVRKNVSLDDLIPVELTDAEKEVAMAEIFKEIVTLQAKIEMKIPLLTDINISEKVIIANADLTRKLTGIEAALTEGNIDAAEGTLADAYAIVIDLDALTSDVITIPSDESGTSTPEFGEENIDDVETDATSTPAGQFEMIDTEADDVVTDPNP